jgi:hypothetical protein
MSITGFVHSRLCGTLAGAGFWAFILRVFVIHPPKETKPPIDWILVAAYGPTALGNLRCRNYAYIRCFEKRIGPLYYSNNAEHKHNACKQMLRLHHCRSNTSNRQFHIV